MGVRTIGYRFTGDYRDLDQALDRMDARIRASVTNAEKVSGKAGAASAAAAKSTATTVERAADTVEKATARVAAADGRAASAAGQYEKAQKTAAGAAAASAAAQEKAALSAQAAQAATGTAAEVAAARQVAAADAAAAKVAAAQARTAATAEAAARREANAYERAARDEIAARNRVEIAQKRSDAEAERAAEKRARASSELGRGLVFAGGATALGIGIAVKAFADFDKAMSRAAAGTQATAEQQERLRTAAIAAGAATQFSATDAADAITELGKAGVSVQDILGGGLNGALDLAAAGELSVADAAEIAATALKQFGLSGKDIPHVADLLAAGAGKAQGSVADLAGALKYVGPVAANLKIPLEQTVGVLAELASKGIIGEQAGTSTRGFLLSLTAPSQKAAREIEALGINLYDAQGKFVGFNGAAGQLKAALSDMSEAQRQAALGTIFGNEQITAATILYGGGSKAVDEWTGKVNDAGFAARQAAQLTDNLSGDLERLQGSLSTVFVTSGSGANGFLRGLTKDLTSVINTFGGLPPALQQSALGLGAVVAAAALAGGAALILIPKIAATRLALVELGVTAEGTAARVALLAKATAVVAALYAVGAAVEHFKGQVEDSAVPVDRLDTALQKFTAGQDTGKIGSLGENFDYLGGKLHELAEPGFMNRFADFTSTVFAWSGGSTKGSDGRRALLADLENLDKYLTGLVQSGHADEAARQFAELNDKAVSNGAGVDQLARHLPQFTAAAGDAAHAAGLTGQQIESMGGATAEATTKAAKLAKALADAEAGAEKLALGAFKNATDVLATYDPAAQDAKSTAATEKLTKAKEHLDDVEKRIAGRKKGATPGDDIALRKAKEAVDDAQKAGKGGATSLAATYRDTIKEARAFTTDISAALKQGLDPALALKLLEEGPAKAGPILRELVSDHSGRLIKMVNESEKTLAKLGALAVEQSRLTARAIASDTDQMTTDLGTALQIAAAKSKGGAKATADSIARALKLAPGEVERIGSEFGITLAKSTQAEIDKRAIDVKATGTVSVETEGTVRAVQRLEEVEAAKKKATKREPITIETVGTAAAISHFEEVRVAADRLANKAVTVAVIGASQAVSQAEEVQDALKKLRNKKVYIDVVGRGAVDAAVAGAVAAIGHNADGGPIRGQGGPRQDNLLSWVSNREWIQPVRAVDYYGEPFMEAVRTLRLPRFADGGQVGARSAATSSPMASTVMMPGRTAAPVVIRVPVHETHTRTFATGDVHVTAREPEDFALWAQAQGDRAAAMYS